MYVEPQIREITIELLNIIRETENDDLTSVMQKIVCTYTEQLTPVAKDMCKHLVDTFAQVIICSSTNIKLSENFNNYFQNEIKDTNNLTPHCRFVGC